MNFTLKGNLNGLVCGNHSIPVKNSTVKLYHYNQNDSVVVATNAQPKELFKVYNDAELKEKSKELIAETQTDENGNYVFNLDAKKHSYKGGPVEIVLYYNDRPDYGQENKKTPKKFEVFGVRLNILQPRWRETNDNTLIAVFNFSISSKIWCYILSRLDLWIITGKVTICNTTTPVAGIEVIAMDDDVISDDKLGSAFTNASGQFLIVYTSKEFKKTFLSPVINIETPILPLGNGPDVYFKYANGGTVFHAESPSRGRMSDRENVGNCFCVSLCIKEGPDTPVDTETIPGFFKIGQVREYDILNNVDLVSGRTANKSIASWNDMAFYSSSRLVNLGSGSSIRQGGLALLGSLNKQMNGNKVEYKFQYEEYDAPGGTIIAPWQDAKKSDIANTIIGYAQVLTGDPANPVKNIDYAIHPNTDAGEMEVFFDATDTWIQVPDMGNFVVSSNGLLIRLLTEHLMSGSVNMAGLIPGTDAGSVQPLQKNRYFKLRMIKREQGIPASETVAGTSNAIALFNKVYTNVPQGGSWGSGTSNERGVASLDIKEMNGVGCTKITNSLTVQYTAATPNLGNVWVSMTGPVAPGEPPHSFPAITHNTPGEEAHGEVAYSGNVSKLPNCAFIVYVHADINLTNGEYNHHHIWDHMPFCR